MRACLMRCSHLPVREAPGGTPRAQVSCAAVAPNTTLCSWTCVCSMAYAHRWPMDPTDAPPSPPAICEPPDCYPMPWNAEWWHDDTPGLVRASVGSFFLLWNGVIFGALVAPAYAKLRRNDDELSADCLARAAGLSIFLLPFVGAGVVCPLYVGPIATLVAYAGIATSFWFHMGGRDALDSALDRCRSGGISMAAPPHRGRAATAAAAAIDDEEGRDQTQPGRPDPAVASTTTQHWRSGIEARGRGRGRGRGWLVAIFRLRRPRVALAHQDGAATAPMENCCSGVEPEPEVPTMTRETMARTIDEHKMSMEMTTASEMTHAPVRADEDPYECKVCFVSPEGRVHQCPNGHYFCETCMGKVDVCPTCRVQLPAQPIRCLVVEQILAERKLRLRSVT